MKRWLSAGETDMPTIEKDDPEMSYQRGYQHGASELFRAVERFLNPATRESVRTWIEQDINGWRISAIVGPPTWRLTNLNVPKSS